MCRTAENSTKKDNASHSDIMAKPNAIQMQTFLITVNSNKQYYSLKSVAHTICQMESSARCDLDAHDSQSALTIANVLVGNLAFSFSLIFSFPCQT